MDANGRFLFLKGHIGGVKVTLATVYVPNVHQDTFISKTLTKLAEFAEGKMILGGDFNIPLDPRIDTSPGFPPSQGAPGGVSCGSCRRCNW